MIRKLLLQTFLRLSRPFGGYIANIPFLRKIACYLYPPFTSDNPIILKVVQGQKMYLDLRDYRVAQGLFQEGILEKGTTRLFYELCEEGMTVIDIGANIGYFTLIAAKLVGLSGKVFAFEPDPNNFALLKKNVELNGYNNVFPVQKAISDKVGNTKLFLDPLRERSSILYPCGKETIVVDTTTLDEFLANKECTVDVIKMDIDGVETLALRGGEKTIKENNVKLIMEFEPKIMQSVGFSPRAFLNNLKQYGFEIYFIKDESIEMVNIDDASENNRSGNLLCIKKNATESKI